MTADKDRKRQVFSPLTLGTVALGMEYGISNAGGKPSRDKAQAVLEAALQAGITTFDTARSYGDAEALVGHFLSARSPMRAPVRVVTKFKISQRERYDLDTLREEVFGSVRCSLAQLRLPRLPVCLLHMDRRLPMSDMGTLLPRLLGDLLGEGLIDMGGVSLDHPREAEAFVDQPVIEAFQVPVNIFDQRLIQSGMLARMQQADKVVFARSVFLQGLFFTDPKRLRGNLAGAVPYLQTLRALSREAPMDMAQLALSFVRDQEGIDSIVFGAVSPEQVRQNAALQQGPALSADLRARITQRFAEVPEEIITPGGWDKQNNR